MTAPLNRIQLITAAVLVLALPTGLVLAQDPSGGPDDFGMTYADNTDPDGPQPDFHDIQDTGLALGLADPGVVAALVELEQPFYFYCAEAEALLVSQHGYATTDLEDDGGDIDRADELPTDTPGARMYALWGEIALDHPDSEVYAEFFEDGPVDNVEGNSEPTTILQWQAARVVAGEPENSVDVQVLLFHETGEVRYQYRNVTANDGTNVTIGIQDANEEAGLLYAADLEGALVENRAVSFLPPNEPCPVIIWEGEQFGDGDTIDIGTVGIDQLIRLEIDVANFGYGTLNLEGDAPELSSVNDLGVNDVQGYSESSLDVGERSRVVLDLIVLGTAPQATATFLVEGLEPINVMLMGDGVEPEPEVLIENPNGEPIAHLESDPDLMLDTFPADVSMRRVYTVRNVGSGPLELEGDPVVAEASENVIVHSIEPYSETELDPRLTPDGVETATFAIEFEVEGEGSFLLQIDVSSNDPVNDPYSFFIEGVATLQPFMVITPEVLDFGGVSTDSTRTRTLTVANQGSATLLIDSIEIGGPDAGRFSSRTVELPLAEPLLVEPGAEEELNFRFSPNARRTFNGNVTISSNSPGESAVQTVDMTGRGEREESRVCAMTPTGTATTSLGLLALLGLLLVARRRRPAGGTA